MRFSFSDAFSDTDCLVVEIYLEDPCDIHLANVIVDEIARLLDSGYQLGDLLSPFGGTSRAYSVRPSLGSEWVVPNCTLFDFFYRSPDAAACSDASSRLAFHRAQLARTSGTRGPHATYLPGFLESASDGRLDYRSDRLPDDEDCSCGACQRIGRPCFQFVNNNGEALHGRACVPCWVASNENRCTFRREFHIPSFMFLGC